MKDFEKFNKWLILKDRIAEPSATPQEIFGAEKTRQASRTRRAKRERVVPAFQKCKLCEEVLPAEEFSPSNQYRSGLRPYCRRCMNVYDRVRREKVK